jgi:hypothetical protein
LGRDEEAIKEASFVGERWRGPDQDEALELWNSIPAEKRPPDAFVVPEILPGTQTAHGTLLSVNCDGKEQSLSVTIQNPDGTLTFRGTRSYLIGYSDSIWFGSDHFTPCHHLDGLRAIVRYKRATDKQVAGEWMELELRDDLPTPPEKSSTPPVDAKN